MLRGCFLEPLTLIRELREPIGDDLKSGDTSDASEWLAYLLKKGKLIRGKLITGPEQGGPLVIQSLCSETPSVNFAELGTEH